MIALQQLATKDTFVCDLVLLFFFWGLYMYIAYFAEMSLFSVFTDTLSRTVCTTITYATMYADLASAAFFTS